MNTQTENRIPSTLEAREVAKGRGVIVPPTSWNLVVATDANAKVQATWLDAKGRKQYGYHADAVAARADHKFSALPVFESHLPALRTQVAADLQSSTISRRAICAVIVRIIDVTAMRVGSEQYAAENGTYGASSLRKEHVSVSGDSITFEFVGKHAKAHTITMVDASAARIITQLLSMPGERLMQDVTETTVNAYLKPFGCSAKCFRTFHATRIASEMAADSDHSKKSINEIVKAVAAFLGNTPAVCKSSYINPAVFSA